MEDSTRHRYLELTGRRFNMRCCGVGGADLRSGRRGTTHQRFVDFINGNTSIRRVNPHGRKRSPTRRKLCKCGSSHQNLVADITGPNRVVYVSQLLPFPAMQQHRGLVIDVNDALLRLLGVVEIARDWRHRGLWLPTDEVFDLNATGTTFGRRLSMVCRSLCKYVEGSCDSSFSL